MKYFVASIPLLAGILFPFINPGRLMASDFMLIAWNPGQELLATGSVYSNYPYPLWTVVVMLPLTVWPLQTAMNLWFFLNILMLAASLAMIFLLTDLELSPFLFGAAVLASGFYLPVLSSSWLGQLSIFSLFILALTAYCFRHQRWTWLGVVLGLSFIKPQVMIMLTGLILLWALLHRRWQTLLGFGGVIALLTLISLPFIASPGQIIGGGIASHLGAYIGKTSTIWGLSLILGIPWFVPALISIGLIAWLGVLWWPFLRQEGAAFDRVLALFSAAILVNLITIPYSWMHNLTLLLLPIGYCLALALRMHGSVRYFWLALLFMIMHPLMLGLYVALYEPAHTQVYQVIPAMALLPTMFYLEHQKNRSPGLVGKSVP
ncbi:MAG: glycosyltransferase family 87 protein [Bacteroidota bacterium]